MNANPDTTPNLHAGLMAATILNAPAAAGALAFAMERRSSANSPEPGLFRRMLKAYELWRLERRVRATLGLPVPVGGELLEQMMLEVERHQWLEAERAGRNVWAERDPRNPRRAALRDWFAKYFGAWYIHQAPKVLSPSQDRP